MSIWKEQSAPKREAIPMSQPPAPKAEASPRADIAPTHDLPRRTAERESKESLIAADLTIEGKIEGSGHVRIAGRFKGDINVQGHPDDRGRRQGDRRRAREHRDHRR